ncbi:MAG: hypothetical protein U0X91_31545 [Spirosomataceae bacterium]
MRVYSRISAIALSISLVFGLHKAFAQLEPKAVPPSPNAAGLGKYGEIPVSHYTGVPNIGVPIYEIKTRDLNVPIALSYHAGGIRVEEEASSVGLGWSLIAGGVITKSIRGNDDFPVVWNGSNDVTANSAKYGFFQTSLGLPTGSGSTGVTCNRYYDKGEYTYATINNSNSVLSSIANSQSQSIYDGEPDIFSYNVGGKTGKFIIETLESGVAKIRLLSHEVARIKLISNDNTGMSGFSIKFGDGAEYQFAQREIQQYKTYDPWVSGKVKRGSGTGTIGNPNSAGFVNTYGYTIGQNQQIPYKYTISSWYLTKIVSATGDEIIFEYTHNGWVSQLASRSQTVTSCSIGQELESIFSLTQTDTRQMLLSKITFRNGTLDFGYDNRDDLYANGKRLVTIILKDRTAQANEVKRFELSHDYFNSGTGAPNYISKRLRLDSVKEKAGSNCLPAHSFSYNTTQLPDKDSYGIDHWGFYNGKDLNPNLIHYVEALFANNIGAPFRNWHYTYGGDQGSTIAERQTDRNASDSHMKACILTKVIYPTGGYSEFEYEPHNVNNVITTGSLTIRGVVLNDPNQSFGSYTVGGLRVTKITHHDALDANRNIIKKYTYSGGKLMFGIFYYTSNSQNYTSPNGAPNTECAHRVSSSSYYTMGSSAQGNHVGYTTVSEYEGLNGENGRTDYIFKNVPESNSATFYFNLENNCIGSSSCTGCPNYLSGNDYQTYSFFTGGNSNNVPIATTGSLSLAGVPNTIYSLNGYLAERTVYKDNGNAVSKLINDYTSSNLGYTRGIKLAALPLVSDYFHAVMYKVNYEWIKLNQTEERIYDATNYNSNVYVSTVTQYLYGNDEYKQLASQSFTDSKGQVIKKEYKYSYNIPNSNMVNDYYVRPIMEEKISIAPDPMGTFVQTSKKYTQYKTENSFHVPDFVKTQQKSTDTEYTEITYAYDGSRRINGYSQRTGPNVALEWYDEDGKRDLLKKQTKSSNNTQQITQYNYKSLVGISEMLDVNNQATTYTYDDFERPITIKDTDGQLLKSFTYNYNSSTCPTDNSGKLISTTPNVPILKEPENVVTNCDPNNPTFDLTIINIGSSISGIKPGSNVSKMAWSNNFVTVDAGPALENSTVSNPSIFYVENVNKTYPRYWTMLVETCLPTTGSINYYILCKHEVGADQSYNTHENNVPYFNYANRDGFTELYALNHPNYGFYYEVNGVNVYDVGFKKGLYTVVITYYDKKGEGPAPATRVPGSGNNIIFQKTYYFRIQSQQGENHGPN